MVGGYVDPAAADLVQRIALCLDDCGHPVAGSDEPVCGVRMVAEAADVDSVPGAMGGT